MGILMSNSTREGREAEEMFLRARKSLPLESSIEIGSRKRGQVDGTELKID